MIENFLRKRQTGQTLLEAVVAVAVVVILVGGILPLINASNRRATIARQSTQASKLAEQGMEIVRNIRDVDAPSMVRIGSCIAAPCRFSRLYNNVQDTIPGKLVEPSVGGCGSASWCLFTSPPEVITLDTATFFRTVEISDSTLGSGEICTETVSNLTYTDIKRVRVFVEWETPIGLQTRQVVSCLIRR